MRRLATIKKPPAEVILAPASRRTNETPDNIAKDRAAAVANRQAMGEPAAASSVDESNTSNPA
jgi:hypothetical protein